MLDLPYTTRVAANTIRWGRIGSGAPLVLIHGTPFSSQVWRRIAPLLAEHRTVYYFDLVGYGQSQMNEGQDVSLAVQNKVLAALLGEWGLTRPDVLAHDFGAATALRGYYLDGLRYASLTLFDAVALAPWGSPFVQHVRKHQQAFAGMPDYMHHALLRAYLQTSAANPLSEEALQIYCTPWLGDVGQAAFYRQIAQMDQRYTDEIEPLYAHLDCPVTVLWGADDAWIPYRQGERLAQRLSARPCIRVEHSGHLMQEDRPEAVVAAVMAQLGAKR